MAKQYIAVDGMGQLILGPDWPELEARGLAEGERIMKEQAEEAMLVRRWDETHCPVCGALNTDTEHCR